jgi:hypothetical protein
MPPIVSAMLALLGSLFQSRRTLHLKILALQHQVASTSARSLARASGLWIVSSGPAIPPVGGMAGSARLRAAPHGHRLATQTLPRPLATAEPVGHTRSRPHCERDPQSHPAVVHA